MYGIIRQKKTIYFTAIIISVLLSYWASVKEVVINPDAICYLLSAQNMSSGLDYATHLCDQAHWPFFSMLVFGLASVTKVSYLNSAYLLDGLLSAVSVVSFIAVIQRLNSRTSTLWFAALTILLAHEFNSVREYIIRDHGFWAFYLLSIVCLLQFVRARHVSFAVAWGVSLVIATLFRIEGIIFLLLLPLVIAGISSNHRLSTFLKLNAVTVVLFLIAGVFYLLHPHQNTDHLGRLGEIKFQLQHGLSTIIQNFHAHADILAQQVLSQYSTHEASVVLFLALAAWYVIYVVGNISLLYAVLVIYAWCKKSIRFDQSAQWVLWSYVIINVLITTAFLAENMFLTKRYLLALSLTLMVWVPFALDHLYQQWKPLKCSVISFASVVVVLLFASQLIDFGHSKKYIHDAGIWLSENTPANAKIYSNDYQVMYYSNRFGNAIFTKAQEFSHPESIASGKWHQYDYLALRMNNKNLVVNGVNATEFGSPMRVFANKRGDEVNIYKVH